VHSTEGSQHEGYSKKEMACDEIEAMRSLGFDRFAVVGHDCSAWFDKLIMIGILM